MTVREAIKKMLVIGTNMITLNNGTMIVINDIYTEPEESDYIMSTIKWDDNGNIKAIRNIFCTIILTSETKMFDYLKKNKNWYLYDKNDEWSYFLESQFCIPEREMNRFISANDGIDEYQTIEVPQFMMLSAMSIPDNLIERMN